MKHVFHLRSNTCIKGDVLLINTTHGNNAILEKIYMSLQNVLLFHLKRHVKNSGFVLHHGFQTPRTEMKALSRICFGPCKGIQDSTWILDSGFRIPGTGFQSSVGFRIPWVVFQIPKPRIPNFYNVFILFLWWLISCCYILFQIITMFLLLLLVLLTIQTR